MSPKSHEITPEGPLVTPEERTELVGVIAEQMNTAHENFSKASNWERIKPYMQLYGLIHVAQAENLAGIYVEHLRKMVAHTYLALPKEGQRTRLAAGLLKTARLEAGDEIKAARSFKGDTSKMDEAYGYAYEDSEKLKDLLITDPMILALRKSIRQTRERRK